MNMSQRDFNALPESLRARCTVSKSAAECLAGLEDTGRQEKGQRFQERREGDRYKSKWERLYAAELEYMRKAEEDQRHVSRWEYEAIGLRLPDWGIYWPDFIVWTTSGKVEIHEIKGKGKYAIRDKAKAKFLDARRLFPEFIFKMIQRTNLGWEIIL